MFTEHTSHGITYMTSTVISARHAFSTRLGGVSAGDFASLNLGYNRGDDAANVTENYRRLGLAAGIDTMRADFTNQVHGAVVRVSVEDDWRAPDSPAGPECDGLVTVTPGLAIFCFTADCVPVLLHDGVRGAAGAVHCGWKSTVRDIIGEAVRKMCALGCEPGNIHAAIGPAIGKESFETDSDVPEAMRAWLGGEAEEFIHPGAKPGKYLVDLRGALAARLVQLGLERGGIDVSDEDTLTGHDRYWSHRYTSRHGLARGSQCAVIEL